VKIQWLIKNELAISDMPKDKKDLVNLKIEGINSVLCLVEEKELNFKLEEYQEELSKLNIKLKHFPIKKNSSTDLKGIIECVEWIISQVNKKQKVLIHCHSGRGRTGMIACCYLMRKFPISADEAIEYFRSIKPGSITLSEYKKMIYEYERFLHNKI